MAKDPTPKKRFSILFPKDIAIIIEDAVTKRGEDKSSLIRRAVYKELDSLGILPNFYKKVLYNAKSEITWKTR